MSDFPPCPSCGKPSRIGKTLSDGRVRLRCSDRNACGKWFTPVQKKRGKKPSGKPPVSGAERTRKCRKRLQKSGNEARDARKKTSTFTLS